MPSLAVDQVARVDLRIVEFFSLELAQPFVRRKLDYPARMRKGTAIGSRIARQPLLRTKIAKSRVHVLGIFACVRASERLTVLVLQRIHTFSVPVHVVYRPHLLH